MIRNIVAHSVPVITFRQHPQTHNPTPLIQVYLDLVAVLVADEIAALYADVAMPVVLGRDVGLEAQRAAGLGGGYVFGDWVDRFRVFFLRRLEVSFLGFWDMVLWVIFLFYYRSFRVCSSMLVR